MFDYGEFHILDELKSLVKLCVYVFMCLKKSPDIYIFNVWKLLRYTAT